MKRLPLKIVGAAEQVPRLLTAYGKAEGREWALVLRPTEGQGAFVLVGQEHARVWQAKGGDAPNLDDSAARPIPEAVALVKGLQKQPPAAEPVHLKGEWKGALVIEEGKARVELTRKLSAYVEVRVSTQTFPSGEARWDVQVQRQETWFNGPTSRGKKQLRLASALTDGVMLALGLVGEACTVKETERRGARDPKWAAEKCPAGPGRKPAGCVPDGNAAPATDAMEKLGTVKVREKKAKAAVKAEKGTRGQAAEATVDGEACGCPVERKGRKAKAEGCGCPTSAPASSHALKVPAPITEAAVPAAPTSPAALARSAALAQDTARALETLTWEATLLGEDGGAVVETLTRVEAEFERMRLVDLQHLVERFRTGEISLEFMDDRMDEKLAKFPRRLDSDVALKLRAAELAGEARMAAAVGTLSRARALLLKVISATRAPLCRGPEQVAAVAAAKQALTAYRSARALALDPKADRPELRKQLRMVAQKAALAAARVAQSCAAGQVGLPQPVGRAPKADRVKAPAAAPAKPASKTDYGPLVLQSLQTGKRQVLDEATGKWEETPAATPKPARVKAPKPSKAVDPAKDAQLMALFTQGLQDAMKEMGG